MLLRKEGFPLEDELVLCTVTAVQHHSVFVKLDEYQKSGLIHISEVSPGRIRNIRDFVREGKVIVCKVLRIYSDIGHIDLSLRRVNDAQRRAKLDEIKREIFAEKIVEGISKQHKVKAEPLYESLRKRKEYPTLFSYFEAIVNGSDTFDKVSIEPKLKEALIAAIKDKIKPPEVTISGRFVLHTYLKDGINHIKEILLAAKKGQGITLAYEGAGKYRVIVTSNDFKDAEKILERVVDKVLSSFKKLGGIASFQRDGA